jgi:plasmid stabilization system protein ParE
MVKWTPKSEVDLDQIREHIAKNFSADLAIKFVNQLIDYVEKTLVLNPLAGKILDSNPLFSKIVYKGNSIFYCENPKDKDLYVVYVRPRRTDLKDDRIGDEEVA